jgi:SAM-dependent methyltransferase
VHVQVLEVVERLLGLAGHARDGDVLEIGSLDVNGSLRPLLTGCASYHGIDLVEGPGVDEVADAGTWTAADRFDLVLCAEVLEHAPAWRDVLHTAWSVLRPGGWLIVTCATDGRAPHSAVDGLEVRPGEHYENVSTGEARAVVGSWAPDRWGIEVATDRGDLALWAQRIG